MNENYRMKVSIVTCLLIELRPQWIQSKMNSTCKNDLYIITGCKILPETAAWVYDKISAFLLPLLLFL